MLVDEGLGGSRLSSSIVSKTCYRLGCCLFVPHGRERSSFHHGAEGCSQSNCKAVDPWNESLEGFLLQEASQRNTTDVSLPSFLPVRQPSIAAVQFYGIALAPVTRATSPTMKLPPGQTLPLTQLRKTRYRHLHGRSACGKFFAACGVNSAFS